MRFSNSKYSFFCYLIIVILNKRPINKVQQYEFRPIVFVGLAFAEGNMETLSSWIDLATKNWFSVLANYLKQHVYYAINMYAHFEIEIAIAQQTFHIKVTIEASISTFFLSDSARPED